LFAVAETQMPPVIRLADGDGAGSVQEIHAPIVRDTAISFELEFGDEQRFGSAADVARYLRRA
jgi:hypothetical protein